MNLTVLSVGGSIIAPDKVNYTFVKAFREAIVNYLEENKDAKLILVCGGGAPARIYQEAYREVRGNADTGAQDWLGIKATHLNGELMRAVFSDYCSDPVVTDPTAEIGFEGRILVAAGWKPGFSTDTDAVYLAKRFGGKKVVNLSNIAKVYTDDPRKNPDAKPIDSISWADFRKMVGYEWKPGLNAPFDPIASGITDEEKMTVICADGRNIENTVAILKDEEFVGTVIGD
ncbi:MAG: UMP kinase [Spirochaetales bacterium]|nr:UMP kinase [Candidatus Physcosoma equi]